MKYSVVGAQAEVFFKAPLGNANVLCLSHWSISVVLKVWPQTSCITRELHRSAHFFLPTLLPAPALLTVTHTRACTKTVTVFTERELNKTSEFSKGSCSSVSFTQFIEHLK